MEEQPNEIIHLILSFLDNQNLMIMRKVNKRWKDIIENRIFYCKTWKRRFQFNLPFQGQGKA